MTNSPLGPDGQPINRRFNAVRRVERGIDELIGLCKGVLCDGVVVNTEATYLLQWLDANKEVSTPWPASILYARIEEMLIDKHLDSAEEKELLDIIFKISGANPMAYRAASMATRLPVDEPCPDLLFNKTNYCFTGKFVYGTRNRCEHEIVIRGGVAKRNVSQELNFLVVGLIGSEDWIHSTFGRKIEQAVALRETGHSVAIVSEEHWTRQIEKAGV